MSHTTKLSLPLAVALLISASALPAFADEGPPFAADPISLDRQSPSVVTFGNTPSDIYGEAPLGGLTGQGWDVGGPGPVLHVKDWNYGLGPLDNSDGHSNGELDPFRAPIIYFSGDDTSKGASNTSYRWQANLNQAAGDRFVTNGPATLSPAAVMAGAGPATIAGPVLPGSINLLSLNQDKYNEIASIGLNVPNPYMPNPGETAMDDMDALELTPFDLNGNRIHDTPIYFSLDAISPGLGGFSPADVFIAQPGAPYNPVPFATFNALGLFPNDEVDALAVWDGGGTGQLDPLMDFTIFSLAPGSPFLAGADGVFGTADDYSAADIFVSDFTGRSFLYMNYASLGMLFTDNIDALDVEIGIIPQVFEENPVPEPASILLIAAGLTGIAGLGSRRKA